MREVYDPVMAVLGISYAFRQQRPLVIGVLGEGTAEDPQLKELFSHEGNKQDDRPQALLRLVDKVDSILGQVAVNVVVILSMDLPSRARTKNVMMWYSMEGALLAVARRRTQDVFALTGKQVGDRLGLSKDEAAARAFELIGADASRAGAAALAALVKADRLGIEHDE